MTGKTISHYQVIETLGKGGMGIVHMAEDTRLQRTVALKFLPPEMIRDDEARERFVREAKAAAAINHPNICTVYEIDEYDGDLFIAMEYVRGRTLKEIISEGPLSVKDSVDIAAQVACGLAEAHQRGIVHRDVKPANIMIDSRKRALIMDFGLAKLRDLTVLTRENSTFGTVSYMSPEQGEGAEAGPRSDIWSLGVVLYEMITGMPPFQGEYEVAVLYSIINEKPEPVSKIRQGVPRELLRIIEKALSKNPDHRYSCAEDMLEDLTRLKHRMELEETGGSGHWKFGRVSWKRVASSTIAAAAALAAVFFLMRSYLKTEDRMPLLPGQPFQVTSQDAWESEPAVSPDASRIAYTSDISGNLDIYVINIRGGNPLKITGSDAADHQPDWFPDGSFIAFTSERKGNKDIWKTGQLGGGATLLIENATCPAVSPDGSMIAFCRANREGNPRIWIAEAEDFDSQRVLTDDDDGLWGHYSPAWSPDGSRICYCSHHNLWIVSPSGGRARRITTNGRMDSDPAWASRGEEIYFSSYRSGPLALWRVSLDSGDIERLTTGAGSENNPSLSRDGSRLVYTSQKINREFILRNLITGSETRLRAFRDDYMAAISPDGTKLVCSSERAGARAELWVQSLENGVPSGPALKITDHPEDCSHPDFSPDGAWIVYYRIINERRDIWIIPSSGGQPIRFTNDPAPDIHPAWSPDGKMIAFVSEREKGANIWVAPVSEGRPAGEPRRVTGGETYPSMPSWSPDSRRIAYVGTRENAQDVWICSVDGRSDAKKLTDGLGAFRVRWDQGSGDILASATGGNDHFSLWRVSPSDGSAEEVSPELFFGSRIELALFDISGDGRLIVYNREELEADIWMLEAEANSY